MIKTSAYRDANCHVELHFDGGNITVDRFVSGPESLGADQYFVRLKPSQSVLCDYTIDQMVSWPIISKSFWAMDCPPLGKTAIATVKNIVACWLIP